MSGLVRAWVTEPLDDEIARFIDRVTRLPDVAAVAVMPDVHLAPPSCVGTVVATRTWLYPELLGSDLGCGVSAIPLGVPAAALEPHAVRLRVLEGFAREVPILRRRVPFEGGLGTASCDALDRVLDREWRAEIGTLGRGNHFLELHAARDGTAWLVAHSGSRVMGPAIQRFHLARTAHEHRGFRAIVAESDEGRAYLHDVALALEGARINRAAIMACALSVVRAIVDIDSGEVLDCQHDSVLRETHDVGDVFVHRKGAIALPGDARGVVPGSMGTETFVVTGRGEPASLCSSAHGAGRAVPRGVARRRFDRAHLASAMRGICFDARKANGLLDESPDAYKDVRAVMRAQRKLVSVDETLTPLVVHKGG
jgi:tRNA-splicing ligase RtcB